MTNPIVSKRHIKDGDEEYDALMFWCPGCEYPGDDGEPQGGLHMLPITPTTKKPFWAFTGTLESPTLNPSILTKMGHRRERGVDVGEFICHSYMRGGSMEFLGDCTHALAGQTVPLPPLPTWAVKEAQA